MAENSDKTTILIVDDSAQNVRLLSHVLKKEGYEIQTTPGGREAIEKVEEWTPDIILLDIVMPGLDGYEVCERLKNREKTASIPIIFLSALSETDSKVKGFEVGGVDYITKPFQREEVLARIDLHVRLRQLQQTLKEKIDALEEREQRLNTLNKRKDELMRILSHDIRNPVTGIIGVAQLLSESAGEMDARQRSEMYRTIEESARKIQSLVADLLDNDRAESGISELSREEVNLENVVMEVIELHQPTALTKNITFDTDGVNPVRMALDRQKMDQVLGNLVSNALKFTPEGGTITITAEEKTSGESIVISVSDTGVGIPAEQLERLTNGQGTDSGYLRSGTRGEKGSGLGFDIIKQFTKMHDGSVEIESEVDEGTTISIILPVH